MNKNRQIADSHILKNQDNYFDYFEANGIEYRPNSVYSLHEFMQCIDIGDSEAVILSLLDLVELLINDGENKQ